MKKLKSKEIALIVFGAVGIFGAQFLSFLGIVIDSIVLEAVIIALWSLFYVILITLCIKESERRFAVAATVSYLAVLSVRLFYLISLI